MTEQVRHAHHRMDQFKADLKESGYIAVILPIKDLPGLRYELATISAERVKSKRWIDFILTQIKEAQ